MRKKLANLDAALAVLLEFERGAIRGTRLSFGSKIVRYRLTVMFVQSWLGIEGIHLRWSAIHEEMDHRFRLGREVWLLRMHRVRMRLL